MSWIFACHSQLTPLDSLEFESFHSSAIKVFRTSFLYLAVGGNPKTIFTSKDIQDNNNDSCGWVVTGAGLISKKQSQKIMSAKEWGNFLSSNSYDISDINGHFIAVIWKNDGSLKIFNDLIGLRTVYFLKRSDRFFFSTELDWLTKLIPQPTLNISAFGSRWLTFNQLSHQSLIIGIEKLAPGSEIKINNKHIGLISKNWIPINTESITESFTSCLTKFIFPINEMSNPITLGLSGGLDSRTLLTIFSSQQSEIETGNLLVHSFGDNQDQDVMIANQICMKLNLENEILSHSFILNKDIINDIKGYTRDALLVEPASSLIKNHYLNDDYFKNKIVIDGAGGEIARRQFLNRLRLKGKKHLFNKNPNGILDNIRVFRADIFNTDVLAEMDKGCLQDIESILENFPDIDKIGFDNFIDLMAVKFRFPNYYGPEQCRLDKIILSFSPFVQHTVIQQIFSLDLRFKKNSRLFHDIIKNSQPELAHFPLVKNGVTYFFSMNTITAFIYSKLKQKLLNNNIITLRDKFFDALKVYINDIVSSADIKDFSLYDYNKIKKIVERYYQGDKIFQNQLDWWFTFELWRRNLHLK
ncbi:MAG: hypothetical protein HXY50_10200 [Ignavibacteriaceae bacterium]|nr:hypothetical protein [Ignavibacteriaceae bacterium]